MRSVATDSALVAFHSAVEFCAILNAAIRADRADEMVHAAMFTRAINQRRIQRVANVLEKSRQVLRAPLPGHSTHGLSALPVAPFHAQIPLGRQTLARHLV